MSLTCKEPELRFKEFSGVWVEKKLGKVCEFTQGIQISQTEQITYSKEGYIRYLYIRDFFTNNFPCFVKDSYPHKIILKNEIMMVNTGNTAGKAFMGKTGVLSNNSFKISFNQKIINNNFLYIFLASNFTQQKIRSFFNGAGQPHLGHKNISILPFVHPKIIEQEKIALFLTAVDEKIKSLTCKEKLLQKYKKGVMQKIFSQEIRFRASDGSEYPPWEEKKYGKIYTFYSTNSFSRDNLNYVNGVIKNIHYGDIHTKFSTIFDIDKENLPFINEDIKTFKIKEESYCQNGDLVIADASEDYTDIGKIIEIINLNNEKVLAGLHTFLARPNKEDMALGYAGYLLQSYKIRKQVMRIAQGTKVLSLSSKRLSDVILNIPSKPEQTKIANFLSNIDEKLLHVKSELEQNKEFKKALLQQMFV